MSERPDDPAGDGSFEVQRLQRLFRFFGATQCRGRSPVYEALSEGVAGDDGLLEVWAALTAADEPEHAPQAAARR